MGDFFDTEEQGKLELQLRESYSAQIGLSQEAFETAIKSILSAIQSHGFDKNKVKEHIRRCEQMPDAVDQLVDIVWTPIFIRAEELARASWQGGWGNFLVLSLFVLALCLARLKVFPKAILDFIPSWLTSEWIFFLAAIGVLTGAVHVVRGGVMLAQVRRAARSSTVTQLGNAPRLLDLRKARLHLSVPSVKQTILLLIAACTVVSGPFVAKGTWDAMLRMPAQIIDTVVFGLVLWFVVSAIGLMLMGFAGLIPGRPYYRLDRRGAELVLGALFCWQIAGLGLLVSAASVRSLLHRRSCRFSLPLQGELLLPCSRHGLPLCLHELGNKWLVPPMRCYRRNVALRFCTYVRSVQTLLLLPICIRWNSKDGTHSTRYASVTGLSAAT